MRGSITVSLVALVALGGFVVPAHAGSVSGEMSGTTTLTAISPDVFSQTFTGTGHDALLGAFTVQSQSDVNLSNPLDITISNGTCSMTFPDGTIFGMGTGSGTTTGMGTGSFEITVVYTGGTGLFAGATGEITVNGTQASTGPTTGTITATYVGTLSITPEPGTLALFGQAVAIGAVALVRGRRRKPLAH